SLQFPQPLGPSTGISGVGEDDEESQGCVGRRTAGTARGREPRSPQPKRPRLGFFVCLFVCFKSHFCSASGQNRMSKP
uniref:Uncharacterized protein n=1 Tax=Chrysemys picta bellii TaxID=8478 RepID=A0A8C3INR6_CHRPI